LLGSVRPRFVWPILLPDAPRRPSHNLYGNELVVPVVCTYRATVDTASNPRHCQKRYAHFLLMVCPPSRSCRRAISPLLHSLSTSIWAAKTRDEGCCRASSVAWNVSMCVRRIPLLSTVVNSNGASFAFLPTLGPVTVPTVFTVLWRRFHGSQNVDALVTFYILHSLPPAVSDT